MSDPFEPFKKWQQSHQVAKFSGPKKTKRKAKTSAKNKIIRRLKYRAEYLDEEEKYTTSATKSMESPDEGSYKHDRN